MKKTVFLLVIFFALCHLTKGQDLDSIRIKSNTTSLKADSTVHEALSRIDSLTNKLNVKIDSLTSRVQNPEKYLHQADSLYSAFQKNISGAFKSMQDSLKLKMFGRLNTFDSIVVSKRRHIDSLTSALKIDSKLKVQLDSKIPRVTEFEKLNIPFKKELDFASIQSKISLKNPFENLQLPDLANPQLPKMDALINIPEVKLPDNLNIAQPAILTEAEQVAGLKPTTKEGLGKLAENEVSEHFSSLSGGELNSKVKQVSEAKSKIKELNNELLNPEERSKRAEEEAKKMMKNYLAGKEEIVKKDIESIGKLQLKYRNVADVRVLPKHPPNELKGQPFLKRLVPSLTLQFYFIGVIETDLIASMGYKFTGRFQSGLSGYKRFSISVSNKAISGSSIRGVRWYNCFRVWGGNYAYLELEHSRGWPQGTLLFNEQNQAFISKVNFGIYKKFPLGKYISGHTILLYDVKQISNFPNIQSTSARLGLDFKVSKKSGKK